MAMPIFLEVEVVPTGHILNNVFGRIPRLSDVQLYFFSDDKETERLLLLKILLLVLSLLIRKLIPHILS